jgi:excinuclease UvrABC nuclease subunit
MVKFVYIYKIVNEVNETIYVGKTKNNLEKRFEQHKKDDKHPEKMEYLLKHKCRIVLIHSTTIEFSQQQEQKYIDEFKPRFNRIAAKYDKFERMKKATDKCKEIIKKLNKKNGKWEC